MVNSPAYRGAQSEQAEETKPCLPWYTALPTAAHSLNRPRKHSPAYRGTQSEQAEETQPCVPRHRLTRSRKHSPAYRGTDWPGRRHRTRRAVFRCAILFILLEACLLASGTGTTAVKELNSDVKEFHTFVSSACKLLLTKKQNRIPCFRKCVPEL